MKKNKNNDMKIKKKSNLAKPGQEPKCAQTHRNNAERIRRGEKCQGAVGLIGRLMNANLLPLVCVETRKFRIAHPLSSYADLYKYLNTKFPEYFPMDKPIYNGSNFSKQLNQSKEWQAAYWAAHYNIDDLLETKMQSKLYNDELDNKDLVRVYDIHKRSKENKEILDEIQKQVDIKLTVNGDSNEC